MVYPLLRLKERTVNLESMTLDDYLFIIGNVPVKLRREMNIEIEKRQADRVRELHSPLYDNEKNI